MKPYSNEFAGFDSCIIQITAHQMLVAPLREASVHHHSHLIVEIGTVFCFFWRPHVISRFAATLVAIKSIEWRLDT